jgi:carbonic anhydrase
MDQLIEGYRRFRAEKWPTERLRYEGLSTKGQFPETLVVACSDSRVDPATVFGAAPGQLFIVRNVAGLVPPYQPDSNYHGTSAVLEYGVRVLKVNQIVVLGHAQCGGVQAMVQGAPAEARDFVEPWMGMMKDLARPPAHPDCDTLTHFETEVVRLSLKNLLTFPWIAQAVAAGRLELHGMRFDIHVGELSRLVGDHFVRVE